MSHHPRRRIRWVPIATLTVAVAAALGYWASPVTRAQDAAEDADRQQPPAQLQPGERLKVSILDLGGMDTESWFLRRLSDESRIELPLVGTIDARGVTRFDFESRIADAYNRAIRGGRPVVAVSRLDHEEDHALVSIGEAPPR